MNNAQQLRQQLRAQRQALTKTEQRAHCASMTVRLAHSHAFRNSRRIALYLPADAEMGTQSILDRVRQQGKRCYLPVLRPRPQRSLWFSEYRTGDRLTPNRFGIEEPCPQRRPPIRPWKLDLILLPLVGFDSEGNRLGMGGGFYDRTLACLSQRALWRRPKLIGIAHECQRVEQLTPQPWDIPLDGVVTETAFYRSPRSHTV